MRILLSELKRIIAEEMDTSRQRKRLLDLFKMSLKDRSNAHTLFGMLRTVGVPDDDINRLRISMKGTDIQAMAALFGSMLKKYVS